jgi:hypothetical protein
MFAICLREQQDRHGFLASIGAALVTFSAFLEEAVQARRLSLPPAAAPHAQLPWRLSAVS